MKAVVTLFLLVFFLTLGSCGEEPVNNDFYDDGAADFVDDESIEVIQPEDFSFYWEFHLAPQEAFAVALQGQEDVPFSLAVDQDGLFNDLRMSIYKGSDAERANAVHSGDAESDHWVDPETTIEDPEPGSWYFFLIQNIGEDPVDASIRGRVADRHHYEFDYTIEDIDNNCDLVVDINFQRRPGFILHALESGKTYTIVTDSLIDRLEVFETDEAANFRSFNFPEEDGAIHLVDSVSKDNGDNSFLSLTFQAEPSKYYAVSTVERSPFHWSEFEFDLFLCEGSETCTMVCR